VEQKIDSDIDYTEGGVFMRDWENASVMFSLTENRVVPIDHSIRWMFEVHNGTVWNNIIDKRKNNYSHGIYDRSDTFSFKIYGNILESYFLTGTYEEVLKKEQGIKWYRDEEMGEACIRCGKRLQIWGTRRFGGNYGQLCGNCDTGIDRSDTIDDIIDRIRNEQQGLWLIG